jgi:hypothetical protein
MWASQIKILKNLQLKLDQSNTINVLNCCIKQFLRMGKKARKI